MFAYCLNSIGTQFDAIIRLCYLSGDKNSMKIKHKAFATSIAVFEHSGISQHAVITEAVSNT